MIYLLGIDHDVQHNGRVNRLPKDRAEEIRNEFQGYIASIASEKQVQVIAEEWCEEEMQTLLGATTTMSKLAANTLKIEHRYIEPCGNERQNLGIPSGPYGHLPEDELLKIYVIREGYWLRQLEAMDSSTILVVCGALHVQRFYQLLLKNGNEASIIYEGWGKQYMPHNHVFNQDTQKPRAC